MHIKYIFEVLVFISFITLRRIVIPIALKIYILEPLYNYIHIQNEILFNMQCTGFTKIIAMKIYNYMEFNKAVIFSKSEVVVSVHIHCVILCFANNW